MLARCVCVTLFAEVSDVEELLGMSPLQLPALRQLQALNQRVWTFVTCFVQSRRVNTLFECFQAFLAHEGVREFHDLRMGNSFVHTEAVQALYHNPTAMLNVSTRDVLTHLRQFETIVGHDAFRTSSHIDRGQFLQYLAQQYRQPNVETLGVALDPAGFGVYIGLLRRLANQETKELKTLEQEFQRDIAAKVFEVTKDKFSAENRKRALDELLATHLRSSAPGADEPERSASAKRTSHRSTMASLSLEMLKRVTETDVYLDNVLRRKAAAAEQRGGLERAISSQEIAETDMKIRNQLTRFLMATQKSKHHSRIKVVTWVLCGIMAKIHALLLHDDKLPEDKSHDDDDGDDDSAQTDKKRKREAAEAKSKDSDSDDDECDCCCVGLDTCKCKCECECHSLSSDEGEQDDEKEEKTKRATTPSAAKAPSVALQAPAKAPSAVDAAALKREVETYLASYCASNEIASLEQLLMCFVSLEIHLQHTHKQSSSTLDRSTLELVMDLWSDSANAETAWHAAFRQVVAPPAQAQQQGVASAQDRMEVAQFVQQCYAANAATTRVSAAETRQHVAVRAQCEFGADRLASLGLESLGALLDAAAAPTDASSSSSVVKYSSVLLASSELPSIDSSPVPAAPDASTAVLVTGASVRAAKADEAIAALRASPLLVDVAKHTQWQQRFAPQCGALRPFICAHEMILRDHAPSSPSSLRFLFAWNGLVVRVDADATPSALEQLLAASERPTAHAVAVQLVSLLVKCDGELNFPKQLVQAHLRSLVLALRAAGKSTLARFVLDAVLAVPTEFAAFVYALIADVAISCSNGSTSASTRLRFAACVWDACASDRERLELVVIAKSASGSTSNGMDAWLERRAAPSTAAIADSEPPTPAPSLLLSHSASSDTGDASDDRDDAREQALTIAERFARAQEGQEHATEPVSVAPASLDNDGAAPESCHAVIEQIRREQFGIGLAIQDAATSAVLAIQQQRLERALKRLSDELYSENTHFVLELLQNADDNQYSPRVRAKGSFTLTAAREVVFRNNERGFSRANIHAICDVGASTKATATGASDVSIGKKGIGFKSVFKISDSPEVHSNGFHIRFHAKRQQQTLDTSASGGLGYILPFWIDDAAAWHDESGTTFVLPLNAASRQRVDEISESLLAFEPSVLLFLRRMQELCIVDQVHRQRLHFLKETHAATLARSATTTERVQLFSQITRRGNTSTVDAQQQWLVVKRTLHAPAAFGSDSKRTTELAVALPLDSASDSDRPPLQQVFAYLPLRSYGFRFIVQGDFEVPSSREAIVNGSEWNQWLVSRVPELMQHAVASYVAELRQSIAASNASSTSAETEVIARLAHLLALLPFEHEIQAPFRSIVLDTMRAISQTPCLPAQAPTLELVKPVELLDAWDAVQDDDVLAVLTRDGGRALATTIHKRLLHVELAKVLSPAQKTQLQVEKLRASHVLQLLTHAAAQNDVAWCVNMLRLLARLWAKDRHADLLLQELRLIKCFPVQRHEASDGDSDALHWVSLADVNDALFLPTVRESDQAPHAHEATEGFYGDLHVLHDAFAAAVSELPDTRTFLLTRVKLKTIVDHDLIAHHVLPELVRLASSSTSRSVEALNAAQQYVAFLASHVRRCGSECAMRAAIRAQTHVWTASGALVAAAATVPSVFVLLPSATQELQTFTSWLQTRVCETAGGSKSIDIVALDSVDGSSRSDTGWRELFVETLGLPMLLDVTDALAAVALKSVLKWLIADTTPERKQMLSYELATYLNSHWPSAASGAEPHEDVVALLRKTKWLVGSDSKFHRAHKLWLATPATTALFSSDMVPYSRVTWTNEALIADVLRLKRSPALEDALGVLKRLASGVGNAPALSDVVRIYVFLADHAQRSSEAAQRITQAFSERALVLAPALDASGANKFVRVAAAVWSASACSSHLVALAQSYPASLRHFFVDVCGVTRKPSVAALCDRLTQLRAFASASDAKSQWKREVLPICQYFAKQIAKTALAKDELRRVRRALKSTPWLPITTGSNSAAPRWCASKDAPLVAATDDDRELHKLVLALRKATGSPDLARAQIQLVKLDQELLDELAPLLALAKIESMSAHVVATPSVWCDLVVSSLMSSSAEPNSVVSTHKHVHTLVKQLVVLWSSAFAQDASAWATANAPFQVALQRSACFSTLHSTTASAPMDVYLNDQTELTKEQVTGGAGDGQGLPVLALFPWSYFVDCSDDAARVRTFLLAFCGVKSLKAELAYEVAVLGAAPIESAELCAKVQQSFGVAQRVLFHHHRALYDALPRSELLALSRALRCVVVDAIGSLQVVYRVGASFSIRHTPTSCFFDTHAQVLYVVQQRPDEDVVTARFHDVLLAVCRKCFGRHVAASVANVLYLASLQPSAAASDKWLVDTQQLAPLDVEQAGALWSPPPLPPTSPPPLPPSSAATGAPRPGQKKRSLSSLEDGEVSDEEPTKRLRSSESDALAHGGARVFPPLPPSSEGVSSGLYPQTAGVIAHAPPLPPGPPGGFAGALHHPHQPQRSSDSGVFQPPLPLLPPLGPAGSGGADQILSVGNSMTKAEREGIGRWGEAYVYKQLVESHKHDTDVTVEWVNEHEESGKPYDITVSSRGKVVEYVEVKATRTMEKAVFEISMNELDQAAVHGSSYCIYRVFNAGNDALCRVVRMKNPVALVRQKKMQLALVMQ